MKVKYIIMKLKKEVQIQMSKAPYHKGIVKLNSVPRH